VYKYPISHHIFHNLKCVNFEGYDNSLTAPFYGDFKINFIRIKGGGKSAVKQIISYGETGFFESIKIKNSLKIWKVNVHNYLFLLQNISIYVKEGYFYF
jgi:hypothetical protein